MVGEIQEGNYRQLEEYMQLSYIQCKEELGRNGLDFRQCNEKSGREVIDSRLVYRKEVTGSAMEYTRKGSYKQCKEYIRKVTDGEIK